MPHRLMSRNVVLPVAGALVAVGALLWSGSGSEIEIPARPAAVTVELTSIPTPEEPLPEIRMPALRPQTAGEPGTSGSEIHVPPRPTLTLAELSVDRIQEPLPEIVLPELSPRCSSLPRTARV